MQQFVCLTTWQHVENTPNIQYIRCVCILHFENIYLRCYNCIKPLNGKTFLPTPNSTIITSSTPGLTVQVQVYVCTSMDIHAASTRLTAKVAVQLQLQSPPWLKITAADHGSGSRQQITAADLGSRSRKRIMAADYCIGSRPQITATATDHGNRLRLRFAAFKLIIQTVAVTDHGHSYATTQQRP